MSAQILDHKYALWNTLQFADMILMTKLSKPILVRALRVVITLLATALKENAMEFEKKINLY